MTSNQALVAGNDVAAPERPGRKPQDPKYARFVKSKRMSGVTERAFVVFANKAKRPVKIVWLNFNKQPKVLQVVQPGDSFAVKTSTTHQWVIEGPAGSVWASYMGPSAVFTVHKRVRTSVEQILDPKKGVNHNVWGKYFGKAVGEGNGKNAGKSGKQGKGNGNGRKGDGGSKQGMGAKKGQGPRKPKEVASKEEGTAAEGNGLMHLVSEGKEADAAAATTAVNPAGKKEGDKKAQGKNQGSKAMNNNKGKGGINGKGKGKKAGKDVSPGGVEAAGFSDATPKSTAIAKAKGLQYMREDRTASQNVPDELAVEDNGVCVEMPESEPVAEPASARAKAMPGTVGGKHV